MSLTSIKLIQRNSQPPTKRPADEDNLAFDKCTLLSSQGSDAPTTRPTKTIAQGNFTIIPDPSGLSIRHADLFDREFPSYHHPDGSDTAE